MNGKVCASCHVELYPKENGVWVLEYAGNSPYKIWNADLWGCHGCDSSVVLGFPTSPVREHFQKDFNEFLLSLLANKETIIDCYERLPEAAGR